MNRYLLNHVLICASLIVLTISCKKEPRLFTTQELNQFDQVFIPLNNKLKLENVSKKDLLLIHYFNGDCSLCIGEAEILLDVTKDIPFTDKLFIVEVEDTMIFNFYREQYFPNVPAYWDHEKKMEQELEELGISNNTFIVNGQGKVIIDGDVVNNVADSLRFTQIFKQYKFCGSSAR